MKIKEILHLMNIEEIFTGISKMKSEETAISFLYILSYLVNEDKDIEEYIFEENGRSLPYSLECSFKYIFIDSIEDTRYKKGIYYPNTFIQGYLMSYFYLQILNDKALLVDKINKVIERLTEESLMSTSSILEGIISYFYNYFEINLIHKPYFKITTRKLINTFSDTKNVDLVSILILLTSQKNSILDIDKKDFNLILNTIKKYPLENINSTTRIKELFNLNIPVYINWWRSAYLLQDETDKEDVLLNEPPRTLSTLRNIFIEDNIDNRLDFIISLIKDEDKINEIKRVYFNNYLKESDHGLRQLKLREFAHYYVYCCNNNLDITHIESIKQYCEEKSYSKSNNYKNKIINSLRGYFNLAIQAGFYKHLSSNPVKYYLNVSTNKFSKIPDNKVIPPQDIQKIFSIENQLNDFERLFIKLLYHTGLRIGEALNLTIGCIVKITDNAISMVIPPFKTREKPYVILLEDKEVISIIKELVLLRSNYGRVPHYKTNESKLWLLTSVNEEGRGIRHLNHKVANSIIKKACKLAGIKDYTNHCFRHTFAHRKIYQENYDLEDVSILLGHSCIDTISIYSHLTNQEKLEFFSRMLKRKTTVESAKNKLESTEINNMNITLSSNYNRWEGTGWCNHSEETNCPKRYISCYTCPLYYPSENKSEEIKIDFLSNLKILDFELKKEYPIYKDVILFRNILLGIISNLDKINIPTQDLTEVSKSILERAEIYLKELNN